MISVLCVDDEKPLCELTKRMLEETKEFTVDTAGSAEEALDKVKTTAYDAIVSDDQMNGMNGIAFLKALRASGSKIPFIIRVDTSRKDVIISAFENDADFYIGKDGEINLHFAELAHKIRAAVRHRRSDEKYLAYTEHSPVGIFVVDGTGRYVDINPAACRMLGYSRSEFLELHITDITPADRVALELERFSSILLQTGKMSVESLLKKKDGTILPVILDATRLPDDTFMAYCTDITDLKHAEEKLLDSNRILGIALRAAKAGTWDWDFPTGILTWSPEFFELFGLPPDAPPSFETWLNVLHPDDREPAMAILDQSVRDHTFLWNEYRIILTDGTVRWIGAAGSTIYDDTNEPQRMSGVCIDISTRKQAETALRESEALLKRTGRIARVGGWDLDAETLAVSWTEETFHIHEVPVGQTPPLEDAINYFHPDERSRLTDAIRNALETGEGYDMELQFITARGKHLWTRSICEPEVIGGKTIRLIGTFQDITERKKAEEALRKSEERFRGVVETSPIGIAVINPATQRFTLANPGFMQITGYTQDELCKMTVQDITHPDDIQREKDLLKTHFECGAEVFEIIKRYIRKDGAIRDVQVIGKMLFTTPDEDPVAIANVIDVTERRQAVEALRESEERYRGLVDTITSGVAIYDVKGDGGSGKDYIIKSFNRMALDIEGKTPDEVIGKSLLDLRPTIDEYGLIPVFQRVWKSGIPEYYPQKIYIDEKYANWYENRVFRLQSGEIVAVYNDVTDLKRSEEALRESEERYREFFTTSQDCVFITSPEGHWIDFNETSLEMFGYDNREDLMAVPLQQLYEQPEDRDKILAHIAREGHVREYPVRLRRRDGMLIDTLVTAVPLHDRDGSIKAILGSMRDITDRKRAEEALQRSEQVYRHLIQNISDVLFTINTDGIITYISPVVSQFGIADREVQGRPFLDFILPDDYEIVQKAVSDVLSGEDVTVEFRVRNPAGGMFYVHVSARPEISTGNVTGIAGIMTNITSKKDLERLKVEALQKIEENLIEMAVLNDQIRNPLAVIMAAADLAGGSTADDIIRQVREIDAMINTIDRKWVESDKVREFLKKYYGVGV